MGVKRIARAQLSLPERSEIDFLQLLPLLSQQEEGCIHYGEAIYPPEKRTRVSAPLAALQYAIAYHKGVIAGYRLCILTSSTSEQYCMRLLRWTCHAARDNAL